MFETFTVNSPIRVLILTARIHLIKGAKEAKNDLRIALSCFTEGIEVNSKDDRLYAVLYHNRSIIHHSLGMFTRHSRFPLLLS